MGDSLMVRSVQSPVRIAIVGCGNISSIYLDNLTRSPVVEVVACADLILERAQATAAQFGIARASTMDGLRAEDDVDLVVNLTIPTAHHSVALSAIESGKSVYNEKPLALELAHGREVLDRAALAGVRVGCAPDTFLGPGLQTCRRLIDAGVIGTPVAASAAMLSRGHEHWHPDPGFYYRYGGGPMFDMGPYYLSALVGLLGPVRRVSGSARASFSNRTISSQPRAGEKIVVEVPTHVAGVLEFVGGEIGTVVTSFDVHKSESTIEIHGSDGSLSLPDPNGFSGPVRIRHSAADSWQDVRIDDDTSANLRGLGVIDLAEAMLDDRSPRASGELGLHVLEIMHAIHASSETGRHVDLRTTCLRPAPLGRGLLMGQ